MTARSPPQQEQKTTLPPSYLAWSIASLLLCCLPLGLAALICSAGVLSDLDAGRYTAARRKSRAARWLNIADAALGLAAWLTLLAYLGLQALSAAATDAGYGRA